jgi:hypothetical protein
MHRSNLHPDAALADLAPLWGLVTVLGDIAVRQAREAALHGVMTDAPSAPDAGDLPARSAARRHQGQQSAGSARLGEGRRA